MDSLLASCTIVTVIGPFLLCRNTLYLQQQINNLQRAAHKSECMPNPRVEYMKSPARNKSVERSNKDAEKKE
jgi:hypothetical protein